MFFVSKREQVNRWENIKQNEHIFVCVIKPVSWRKQFSIGFIFSRCLAIVTALNRNKASSEMDHDMLQSPGPIAKSVARPTADPGVVGLIPARSLTFVEIDNEIMSTVILLFPLIKEGLVSLS